MVTSREPKVKTDVYDILYVNSRPFNTFIDIFDQFRCVTHDPDRTRPGVIKLRLN